MADFLVAFDDATKANEAMKDAYQASVSDNENSMLTISPLEQAMSYMEQHHATTLRAKDDEFVNMQHRHIIALKAEEPCPPSFGTRRDRAGARRSRRRRPPRGRISRGSPPRRRTPRRKRRLPSLPRRHPPTSPGFVATCAGSSHRECDLRHASRAFFACFIFSLTL